MMGHHVRYGPRANVTFRLPPWWAHCVISLLRSNRVALGTKRILASRI